MKPLTAPAALDRHYLDARCLLLDLAAMLDRIDRGGALDDPRLQQLNAGLAILREQGAGRAEKIQQLFSDRYDASWEKPQPRF